MYSIGMGTVQGLEGISSHIDCIHIHIGISNFNLFLNDRLMIFIQMRTYFQRLRFSIDQQELDVSNLT